MDLNYLYHRRGKSLMMSAQSRCVQARSAHIALSLGSVALRAELRSLHELEAD